MAPQPESLPIDTTVPFSPTQCLYLSHDKSHTYVLDLTVQLFNIFSPEEGISLDTAKDIATSSPPPSTIFTLKKENFLGTHVSVRDGEGKMFAEWRAPIVSLKMGTTRIKFLGEEGEGGGDRYEVEIKPVGVGRRAESFVKDSIPYIWQVEPNHHAIKTLYKIVATSDETAPKKKVEIGRFETKAPYTKDGVLVVDTMELDVSVAVLTLCALLETKDSFSK